MVDKLGSWRTPIVILACGCLIGLLGFGPRSSFGFFLSPMSSTYGWGRDVFAFALAVQMLLWGAAQPFAGALADRFGAPLVLTTGALLYALGLVAMANATTPNMLTLSAGVLIGFGLAGSSFTLVIGAFGRLMPPEWRSLAFGAGTAAGSFGQFLFSPLAVALIGHFGWFATLAMFAGVVLLIAPLSLALAAPARVPQVPGLPQSGGAPRPGASEDQSLGQALREAFRHRSYLLLVLGFFTCGFQIFFITVHLPAYLVDRGLPAELGGWTIAVIGLFNIIGSIGAGWLSGVLPNRFILSAIYFARSLAIAIFIAVPASPAATLMFGAVTGLLWLSTVPPTSALVAIMFGTRWLTTLFGFAFFSHQVGGFLGVWLGGLLFERTGSYDAIWLFSILLGVLSAVVNLPIVEKPVARPALAAA
jgi:MFS family permease